MSQAPFFIGLIVVFFVFMILPQWLQRRRHEQELTSIKPGDWVISIGGIIGQVIYLDASIVKLRVSQNGELTLALHAVRSKIPPRQPFAEESEKEGEPDTE